MNVWVYKCEECEMFKIQVENIATFEGSPNDYNIESMLTAFRLIVKDVAVHYEDYKCEHC